MRIIVIGAGPAGLTAALQLARSGATVTVLEAGSCVGGMSRSLRLWGHTVDLGPHRFFSTDPRVNAFWLSVVGSDYAMVDRRTRILYRGRLFDYPLKPLNIARNLGVVESSRLVASYLRGKVARNVKMAETFEDWVIARFGRRLFDAFFKSYSEKLWGIPCSEISADFAAQRIKQLSLAGVVSNALSFGSGTAQRTLIDRFAYPIGGTGEVYRRIAKEIEAIGGRVLLNTPVKRVVHGETSVEGVQLDDGTIEPADHVISTMPLTRLIDGLSDPSGRLGALASRIGFRNTVLVYLHVNCDKLFPDQWLYVHSEEVQAGRITNFRNWVPNLCADSSTTVVSVEYWCDEGDDFWKLDNAKLVQLAQDELNRIGLVDRALVLDGAVVRVPNCYPVYRRGYRDVMKQIQRELERYQGLTLIGRNGSFKYNNQDHSILMGLLAAENVLGVAWHDLWNVNTDYEHYQEPSVINERGLVSINQLSQQKRSSLVPACLHNTAAAV